MTATEPMVGRGWGRRHAPNSQVARGDDPTTGAGPAAPWGAPPIPADLDPKSVEALAELWRSILAAVVPLQEVQATEDVASAEWSPFFAALPFDGMAHRLTGGFPTRRSFTVMNPATATVSVWLAAEASILQNALQVATLGSSPIEGVMLLAPGTAITFTHRLAIFAGVPVSAAAVGIATGWFEGSARSRIAPWEPLNR